MKKFLIILLAVVMVFALVTVVACKEEAAIVRVKLYVTENSEPITRSHTVGQDDLPTVSNDDMIFDGWYYDKTFNLPYSYTDTEIENGTSLYAKWNTVKVTLTLNPNYDGAESTTHELDKGSKYNLPALSRDGFTFDGWFTSATGGTQWTNDKPITEDTTLHAHWTENSQVVPFALLLNPNYDGAETIVVPINLGDTYKLPSLTRSGYTFDGWFDMVGTRYEGEIIVNALNAALVARWTPNNPQPEQVTLTLNLNYTGAAAATTVTLTKGSTYSLSSPTRSGYTFDGWYTLATGGTEYTSSTPINSTTTLYAHWTEIPADESVKEDFLASVVTQPKENTNYYIAMYYALPNQVYYGTAQISGNRLASTTTKSDADVATIEKTSGGFYIKLGTKYLSLSTSSNKTVISLSSTASTVFYVGENDILIATYDGDEYTIGSYQQGTSTQLYTNFGVSAASYSTGDNADAVDVTQFPIRLVTVDGSSEVLYNLSIDASKPLIVEVGAQIDFKSYFTITDKDGNIIPVTDDMLDLDEADTDEAGTFDILLIYENVSAELTFVVVAQGTDLTKSPEELTEVFNKYADDSTWNFAVDLTYGYTSELKEEYYEYFGDKISDMYTYDGEVYLDYLAYENGTAYWYYDNGDGTYDKISQNSSNFEYYFPMNLIDLTELVNYTFVNANGCYVAVDPNSVGNAVIAEFDDGSTWTSVTVYIANGNLTKLVAVMSDGWEYEFTFSKYGQISFTLPDASSSGSGEGGGEGDPLPTTPTGTMDNQNYDPDNFDEELLQDKLTTTGQYADPYIGLPSTGNYHALVIPIKFSNTTISQTDLNNLNIAFNGTSEQTGWESVQSYYYKSSYGALNLSFDIAGYNIDGVSYYTSNNNYSYYEGLMGTYEGQQYNNGDNVLLHEVLAYYKDKLDLTQYDSNGDGAIDAVYLIYSAPVDYSDDSFYWAYVTWDQDDNTKYDGLEAYYYLFAGFDFMNEKVQGKTPSGYAPIAGLKVNAETFIHETGHLLGLDDYYDYSEGTGGDQGLGGADMMDYNVGDHGVYSKIMLGWLTPEIVTSTQTITIKSSQSQTGDRVILIPLNWNNSYFCEYLLIDLYTATGLNEMGSNQTNSILYNGAEYGVRIYHVTAWANDPYNNSYQSFTDCNNSVSYIPLIKLIEADGETSSSTSGSWASEDDLWQAGQSFNNVFPQYMRNDGKLLNFNITIVSATAEEATITITYDAA